MRRCASASSSGRARRSTTSSKSASSPPTPSWPPTRPWTEYLFREVTTSQHISCTCKMGPADDPMAVVSQYGKVHGLERLRVVDASIMPDCIRANTNVTTMMIGERIAEFIKDGK